LLALGLVASIAVLDAGVYLLVIRPLRRASDHADRVSRGERDVPDLTVRGNDEIAVVTSAFQRMRLSLAKALKMLDDED
jgi:protein-histidine pros-kinase